MFAATINSFNDYGILYRKVNVVLTLVRVGIGLGAAAVAGLIVWGIALFFGAADFSQPLWWIGAAVILPGAVGTILSTVGVAYVFILRLGDD